MNIQTALRTALLLVCSWSFGQKNTTEKRLDSLFSALTAQNQFNGSVLIAEKGKISYKSGKGYSNELTKELNNSKTIFELASCSKQFTGVGIALLHRENKLNYTDDITKFLPELTSFKGVTIYDLLRHTSGIPEFLGGFEQNWKNERIATNQDVINYYAERKDTLEFTPRSEHRYSNTNYVLLATIIERVSGKKWGDYLDEKIFKPLKMNRTFVYNRRLEPKKITNYAYGYSWVNNSFEKATEDDKKIGRMAVYYMDGIYGAAKINSTVEDLYKWINALKNNQLLTKQEFEEVMEITQTTKGEKVDYGFGFDVRKGDNTISFGHTGSWDGYITLIHYNSKKDRTVIILNNFKNGTCPYESITEILNNKPSSNEFVKKIDLSEDKIKQFVGEYTDPSDSTQIHVISYLNGHLIYNTDKLKWDMRFFPSSDNTFQAIRQGGTNGVMEFTRQDDGTMKLEMKMYDRVIGQGIRN
ncbi:serine hydrolase domain-containing protein [Fluviicola taffensis]|uniref:serine hydrolase domain-containing protein n=1 Tax=Fluviicola taffensis TaxID=191579 RepID=UPI003137DBB8